MLGEIPPALLMASEIPKPLGGLAKPPSTPRIFEIFDLMNEDETGGAGVIRGRTLRCWFWTGAPLAEAYDRFRPRSPPSAFEKEGVCLGGSVVVVVPPEPFRNTPPRGVPPVEDDGAGWVGWAGWAFADARLWSSCPDWNRS